MNAKTGFKFNFLPDQNGFRDKDPRYLGHARYYDFDNGFFIGFGMNDDTQQSIFTRKEWREIQKANPDFHLPNFDKNDVRFEEEFI